MNKVDYGSQKPQIQPYQSGYLIPVGIEEYTITNQDSTTIAYRAYQVYSEVLSEIELDKAFGELKNQYPEDYQNAAWYEIRQKRDQLLSECDWTQLADVPNTIDKSGWANYRQKLRDITKQKNPFEVVFPTL